MPHSSHRIRALCAGIALVAALRVAVAQADGPEASAPHRPLDILVVRDGWGSAPRENVLKLLESTAQELWKNFPSRDLEPIIVRPKGGPITAYQRGPNGEYFVMLGTGDTAWSQYAYQFAHELCHILCGYDTDPHGQRWFEESLCEMASLYALRRMGENWKTAPPYANWKEYAPSLTQYAQNLIDKGRLPEGRTLAQWYGENAAELAQKATVREKNLVAAVALLPMFEQAPEHWQAVGYLNTAKVEHAQTFREHLTDWLRNCPDAEKPFVREIAKRFEVELE